MKRLKGTRAVITGAGSGLGRALCLELAKQNWRILVSDIDEARARETLQLVLQAGGSGEALCCDVADSKQVASLADRAASQWGGADLLVNNAGVAVAGFVGRAPLENWQWVLDIDLWGVIYGCHFFIPLMKKAGAGHIVNIASGAGMASLPEMGPYNVAKAGVISLSETLRSELAPCNIGVTAACPTFFTSRLLETMRYDTEEQYRAAQKMFEWASMDSGDVARCVLRAVRKNRLYVFPQKDAWLTWYAKRLFPSAYYAIMSWGYRRRIHARFLH